MTAATALLAAAIAQPALTVHPAPPEQWPALARQVTLALNRTSNRPRLARPAADESGTIILEPHAYATHPQRWLDAWNTIATRSPYGQPPRADWWLAEISKPGPYYALLGTPDTYEAIHATTGGDPAAVARLRLRRQAAILGSRVARDKGRQVVAEPTLTGLWTFTRDTRADADPLAPDAIEAMHADASEVIWTLPNGMLAYAIVNAANKRIDAVDPEIAQDYRSPIDAIITAPRSCIGCHDTESQGFQVPDDALAPLLSAEALHETDLDRKARIEDLYTRGTADTLNAGGRTYAAAVKALTGQETADAAEELEAVINTYQARLDQRTAEAELGHPLPPAGQPEDPQITVLRSGPTISRSQWERLYPTIHQQRAETPKENDR